MQQFVAQDWTSEPSSNPFSVNDKIVVFDNDGSEVVTDVQAVTGETLKAVVNGSVTDFHWRQCRNAAEVSPRVWWLNTNNLNVSETEITGGPWVKVVEELL